jgi:hypothetical protein
VGVPMSSPTPGPRERLEALTEQALDRLEADAKRGKPPTAAELNGVRRLVVALEQAREQDRALERANALTRSS